jgi:5-methylthioadenosine/S-adenosylhomocysteine deaminase
VAHNISSNLKLASGVAPLGRFRRSGLNFGLGTDSTASNNVLDPFREMRMAALMQRGEDGPPTAYDMLEAATRNGAAALGLAGEVGSIEPGKRADIVLVDLDRPHLQPRAANDLDTLASLLVFAASARDVDTVIIDGRIVMRARQVLTMDAEAVHRGALAALERLMARAGDGHVPHH